MTIQQIRKCDRCTKQIYNWSSYYTIDVQYHEYRNIAPEPTVTCYAQNRDICEDCGMEISVIEDLKQKMLASK